MGASIASVVSIMPLMERAAILQRAAAGRWSSNLLETVTRTRWGSWRGRTEWCRSAVLFPHNCGAARREVLQSGWRPAGDCYRNTMADMFVWKQRCRLRLVVGRHSHSQRMTNRWGSSGYVQHAPGQPTCGYRRQHRVHSFLDALCICSSEIANVGPYTPHQVGAQWSAWQHRLHPALPASRETGLRAATHTVD